MLLECVTMPCRPPALAGAAFPCGLKPAAPWFYQVLSGSRFGRMRAHYELFDHTADIGVRVFARSLTGLLVPATAGFYAVIGHLATCGHPAERQLELTGDDSSLLLRDYLTELLHLFESERRQLTNLVVREFTPEHLSVVGQARLIDRAESVFEREVKAVTYHELAIRPVAGGYEATYIVDI